MEHSRWGENWDYLMGEGAYVKRVTKLGLLEGERGNGERVKIGISGSLKEHCIRVENYVCMRVNGAL